LTISGKTYKKIKDGNGTGNAPQKWEFFHVMDSFMQKKPEVTPAAVCSVIGTSKDDRITATGF
jgi:hypothetical protein